MTPKEKAQELIHNIMFKDTSFNRVDRRVAKKCALICVENEYYSNRELLMHLKGSGVIENEKIYLGLLQNLIDEEKQVKQEIKKL